MNKLRHAPLGPLLSVLAVSGVHAQESVSGRFYRHEVVAAPGIADIGSVSAVGSAINQRGQVAFVGRTTGFLNAVYVWDPGAASPRKIAQQNIFSFIGAVDINDNQHVVALEQLSVPEPDGFRKQYLRDYDATPPGPYTNTVIAGAVDAAFNDFKQIRPEATINNGGRAGFSALRNPTGSVNALVAGRRPSLATADLAHPLRPMIADDDRVVVRAGGTSSDPIRLYAAGLASFAIIADASMGFTALGQSPGLSPDGSVVVFYGDLNAPGAAALQTNPGPGVFASIETGPGARRIVRVAGRLAEDDRSVQGMNPANGDNDGVCDPGELCIQGELGFTPAGDPLYFSGFSADARVAVVQFAAAPAGPQEDTLVIAFVATPIGAASPFPLFSGGQGLWTVRVDLRTNGPTFIEKPHRPIPVVQVGDRLGSRTATSVSVYNPIASVAYTDSGTPRTTQFPGEHQLAFLVGTSAGFVVVRSSRVDSDQDGLLDHWETSGLDFDQDGAPDLPLNAAPFSARWNHKDVFVEVDYMQAADHSHLPGADSLTMVTTAFENAPLPNPDGLPGIALHAMLGKDAIPELTPLRFGGPNDDFDGLKLGQPVDLCPSAPSAPNGAHLGLPEERRDPNCLQILSARHLTFRYAVFGHDLSSSKHPTGSSEIFGNDFVLTLSKVPVQAPPLLDILLPRVCRPGEVRASCRKRIMESGVFMHELGHTLGLMHGGGDDINCKPNYLSVMSYSRTWPMYDTDRRLDYSDAALPILGSLNEASLDEPSGIGGPAGQNVVYGAGGVGQNPVPANGPINWDSDAFPMETNVSADINYIARVGCPASPAQVLEGFDDWGNLRFAFSESASSFSNGVRLVAAAADPTGEELTLEAAESEGDNMDPDGDGLVSNQDNCPWTANPTQTDTDGDGYGDACDPGDATPPLIAITAPAEGAEFPGGGNVSIAATASDPDGTVLEVRFLASNAIVGQAATAPYATVWENVLPGHYALTAEAMDNDSAVTVSTAVNMVVHGADLAVSCSDGGVTAEWGRSLSYTIAVTNNGPDTVGATVVDTFPASLAVVTWTCSATAGSSCPTSGSGNISAGVSLAPGGTASFSVSALVAHGTVGPIVNAVSVSSPTYDPYLGNNQATTSTPVNPDPIFKDGFDGP